MKRQAGRRSRPPVTGQWKACSGRLTPVRQASALMTRPVLIIAALRPSVDTLASKAKVVNRRQVKKEC